MHWVSFITGGMSVIMANAIFTSIREEEEELAIADRTEANVVVNDLSGRYVTLSCQSCRKLKRHKEIEPDVYQCTKCKRHTDLRRGS